MIGYHYTPSDNLSGIMADGLRLSPRPWHLSVSLPTPLIFVFDEPAIGSVETFGQVLFTMSNHFPLQRYAVAEVEVQYGPADRWHLLNDGNVTVDRWHSGNIGANDKTIPYHYKQFTPLVRPIPPHQLRVLREWILR